MGTCRILFFVLALVASCAAPESSESDLQGSESAEIAPLALKTGRQPFCGIESYRTRRDALCGVELYKEARSSHCPVELYRERAHVSCPGSLRADRKELVTTGSCSRNAEDPPRCPAGYRQEALREKTESCRRGRVDMEWDAVVQKKRICVREEQLRSCRRPEFGVERYKVCRHSSHGVERYKACARPEFGTMYKSCSYYMAASEIEPYLNRVEPIVHLRGQELINYAGLFYSIAHDEVGLACIISRYEEDPLYEEIVTDLMLRFKDTFGKEYAAEAYDCSGESVNASIDEYPCDERGGSPACFAKRYYQHAKSQLLTIRENLTLLINDHAARQNAALKREIETLRRAVEDYQK